MFGLVVFGLLLAIGGQTFQPRSETLRLRQWQAYVLLFFIAFGIVVLRRFPRPALAALAFACLYSFLPIIETGAWNFAFGMSNGQNINPLDFPSALFASIEWALTLTGFLIAWPLRNNAYAR
jgi:hypothetical protein